MALRIDLHVHSHHSPDSLLNPEELARACSERGLDGVAVTDHDRLQGALEIRDALPHLVIIPGEEIRSREGEITGLFLREEIPPGLSAEETMMEIRKQGGLVCVPHPFDYIKLHRLKARRLLELRELIDCLEAVNGKPRWWGANGKALSFAYRHGFPVTAGSDAHRAGEVGRAWVEMEAFDGPAGFLAGLKTAVLHGRRHSPWAGQMERWKARLRG